MQVRVLHSPIEMFNFPRLASDYRIPLLESGHHHCVEGWVQSHCPFCSARSGWHLGWCLAKGYFSCWRCGKLKTYDVLSRLIPGTSLKSLYKIYGRKGSTFPLLKLRKPGQATKITYPSDCGPLLKAHRAYLALRRFNVADLEARWGLRGVGRGGGPWAWRILAPIHDHEGRVISYTGRAIGKQAEPRYLTLGLKHSILNPKTVLYGEHLVPDKSVIVVEGPTDAWRIGPGAVATLGVAWSIEQAMRLRRFKRITFLPDNDSAGLDGAKRYADWLSSCDSEIEIVTGLDTDPGNLDDAAVKEIQNEWL